MSNKIIIAQDLLIKRGERVLQKPISFTWKQGQQWCVTGPTGSGKTTLLQIISGLTYVSEGFISYPFLEGLKESADRQVFLSDIVAFVPQEINVPSHYIEDLYYQRRFQAAEMDSIPSTYSILLNVAQGKVELVYEASKLMGLSDLLDQPFVQLSNGQTRRLMIAVALVKQPKLLILDNPYTGLDQEARLKLNAQLKILIRHGIHIFMAVHLHELPIIDFVTNTLELDEVMEIKSDRVMPGEYARELLRNKGEVVKFNGVQVRYGEKVVLDIPHWVVNYSDRWVIQGKNGSGKSILLSLIMADHPQAYANEIYMFGNKRGVGESIWEVKKRIGYFSPELLRFFSKNMKVAMVIASGQSDFVGKVSKYTAEQKSQVESIAYWLGIDSLLSLRMGDLSLGQQKMVLIARAMMKKPEMLILDEPLQGMDVDWREHFKSKIDEFAKNRTVLYVTHDIEEIPDGEWQVLNL